MKTVAVSEFLQLAQTYPVVDVRTVAEFDQGHIPDAFNIALFSNEERAKVGTAYKKQSKEAAVELGLAFVGKNLVKFVRQAKKIAVDKTVLLHCWRGGMRSASMGWLFETAGLQVILLQGGYKAYRTYIREAFDKAQRILILSGSTGSGKTDILHVLDQNNQQIIDLEGLANHKGSAFGAIGQREQGSSEQFENNLAVQWLKLNMTKPIWIEDESRSLGRLSIPDNLYQKMRQAEVICLHIPKKIREKRLVKEYADLDKEELRSALLRIEKKLGGKETKDALEALDKDDFLLVADVSLSYYDKAYDKGLSKRNQDSVIHIELLDDKPAETAERLIRDLAL